MMPFGTHGLLFRFAAAKARYFFIRQLLTAGFSLSSPPGYFGALTTAEPYPGVRALAEPFSRGLSGDEGRDEINLTGKSDACPVD